MNKITVFSLIVIMTLSLVLVATMQSKASNKNYAGVVPFSTSNDRLGLLDQNTGRIYVYDDNYSQCLFVGQIGGLGQPIQAISK